MLIILLLLLRFVVLSLCDILLNYYLVYFSITIYIFDVRKYLSVFSVRSKQMKHEKSTLT